MLTQIFQDGWVEIKVKFQNPFIMCNVICFTWVGWCEEFLGKTEEQQIECLKVLWGINILQLRGTIWGSSKNWSFWRNAVQPQIPRYSKWSKTAHWGWACRIWQFFMLCVGGWTITSTLINAIATAILQVGASDTMVRLILVLIVLLLLLLLLLLAW
jgi:hypothetical protein